MQNMPIILVSIIFFLLLSNVNTSAGSGSDRTIVPLSKMREYATARQNGKWGLMDTVNNKPLIPFKYDEIGDALVIIEPIKYSEGRGSFTEHGTWGFMDPAWNVVIEAKYQNVRPFKDGMAAVALNKRWSYIDRNGREMSDFLYDEVKDFSEGMAAVGIWSREHNKRLWGFIDKTGKQIVPPKYDSVQDFKLGVAKVTTRSSDADRKVLSGFIDRSGKEVLAPQDACLGSLSEGMVSSCAETAGSRERLWGFMNLQGETIVPPRYSEVADFHEGRAAVRRKNEKYTFIDKTGRELFPPRYGRVENFSEGLAVVMKSRTEKSFFHTTYGFIDRTGKEVIPVKYTSARSFKDGRAQVLRKVGGNLRLCYIDKTGREVPRPKEKADETVVSDLARYLISVKLNGKWGYCDLTGREVVPLKYEDAPPTLTEPLNRMKENGKYGYLDSHGRTVVPAQYDEAPAALNKKLNRVKLNGKYGYLDMDGRTATPATYDDLPEIRQRTSGSDMPMIRISKGGKYGYLSSYTGTEMVPAQYDIAPENPVREKNKVKRDGKWGYMDKQGMELGEFRYEDDPCAFDKKKGDGHVFTTQAVVRSRPDRSSQAVAVLSPGTRITVKTAMELELADGDVADRWYEAVVEEKKGYIWGADIADAAFRVPVEKYELLFLIRNRTNGTNQCYKPQFEMKMLLDGKVLSEYSGRPFDETTTRVTSMEYVPLEGFSAPLYLLKVKFDFTGYKDAYARFGTANTYFYIDDGKLSKVLDVAEEVGGEGKFKDHRFVTELELPGRRTGPDRILYTVYSSRGFSKEVFSKETYQWDWGKKNFESVR